MILSEFRNAVKNVLRTFFASDLDVMSDEVREILSNPEDAQKYKDAVRQIESGETEVTIKLSGNRELTLVQ